MKTILPIKHTTMNIVVYWIHNTIFVFIIGSRALKTSVACNSMVPPFVNNQPGRINKKVSFCDVITFCYDMFLMFWCNTVKETIIKRLERSWSDGFFLYLYVTWKIIYYRWCIKLYIGKLYDIFKLQIWLG